MNEKKDGECAGRKDGEANLYVARSMRGKGVAQPV